MMNKPSIPLYWSSKEALTFVAFLEDIISDIWSIHGSSMAMPPEPAGPGAQGLRKPKDR